MFSRAGVLLSVASGAGIATMIFLGVFGPEGLIMHVEGLWKLGVVVPVAIFVNHTVERVLRTRFGARGHEIADEIASAIGGTAGRIRIAIGLAVALELLSVMCEGQTNIVGLVAGIALPFFVTGSWLAGAQRTVPVRTALGLFGGLVGGLVTAYLTAGFSCFDGYHGHTPPEPMHLQCLLLSDAPPKSDLAFLVVYGVIIGVVGSFAIGSSRERAARTTVKWLIVAWVAMVAVRNTLGAAVAPEASPEIVVVPDYVIQIEIAMLAQLIGWSVALVTDGHAAAALWPNSPNRWGGPALARQAEMAAEAPPA